ncbi:hypothetical protein, partial [Micromonospora sp. NPDC005313]|uniref:hypothetical protein n=1 Tax=Micromonospora sp. NPDC005313 TaxID=3154296 RepID=UPI0033A3EA15
MTGPAAPAPPAPLSAAAARLDEHLRRRWTARPVGPAPRVVTLGAADALSGAAPHRLAGLPDDPAALRILSGAD